LIKSKYGDISHPQQVVESLFDRSQEKDILETFCSYVQNKDPDILIFDQGT
jgi:DNA polymerase elongation subunit (family B)